MTTTNTDKLPSRENKKGKEQGSLTLELRAMVGELDGDRGDGERQPAVVEDEL